MSKVKFRIWLDSISIKNLLIVILAALLALSVAVSYYVQSKIDERLDAQVFEMVPPALPQNIKVTRDSKFPVMMMMVSGYLTQRTETVTPQTFDSYYVPMLSMVSPRSEVQMKTWFGEVSRFLKNRQLKTSLVIDPSYEKYDAVKNEYTALGVVTIRSALTDKILAVETRKYKMVWQVGNGNYNILSWSYDVVRSSLKERGIEEE